MSYGSSIFIPSLITLPPSTSVEPQTTTTSYIPPTTTTTTNDPITTSPITTTTPPPITTTTTPDVTTTTTSPNNPVTTTTPPITTTTTRPPITTSRDVTTSSPVPIVTVTSSGTVVRTYTSTSYSHYVTSVPTTISDIETPPPNSNTGAIVGGVVGGVSFIFIIAFFVFITKRRRSKKDDIGNNSNPFNHDYHSYGSPTVLSDQPTMNKPRPFVQAYDPEQQSQYAGYDGSQSPSNNTYQHDYQAYPQQYYQEEPMMYDYGRNVPDQNDYVARRESRHVPNERPSVPHEK